MKRLVLLFALPCIVSAADAGDQLNFFEKNIRPVLADQCYKCHSAKAGKVKGSLTLDSKEGTVMGGESGHPGITPGQPDKSTVYKAITWEDEDMQMPPKHKLPADVVANFKKWIEMGAPDPRGSTVANLPKKRTIDMAEGRKHWAFQAPVKAAPPTTQNTEWPRTDIDKFVLAGIEAKGLHPVTDADRPTLIRRIAFDLTGLPPTPDEVRTFVADKSPDAVKNVIDQYIDSQRFGERWGRHWMDVARYAESSGKEVNILYGEAWRYRDYVIESFNKDKPYDQFLKEQIAGDLMGYENKRDQAEKIVATGFLAIGPKSHNARDRRQFTMDMVDEQIDAVSQSMLGLTLACARCHDHKFDPVAQRDYYALAGIFLSSDTLYGTHVQVQNNHPSTLIELDDGAGLPSAVAKITPAEVAKLKSNFETAQSNTMNAVTAFRNSKDKGDVVKAFQIRVQQDKVSSVRSDLELFKDDGTPRTLCMGVLDKTYPVNSPILVRGDISQPGETVPRGLVEVLLPAGEPLNISKGSGRLDLAYFIASKDNPLTARVMANRIWLHLFGKGIVAAPDNFGTKGMKPTNQPLLDHLAVRFVENGWSVKRLIREIMLSRVYQMDSRSDPASYAVDPDNDTLWHMNRRRLEAEPIRDAMLAVAGGLNLYPTDGSPVARAGEGREGLIKLYREVLGRTYYERSAYLPIVRDQVPEVLTLFDFPDAALVTGQRDTTNVHSQSLYLMNNPQALAAADGFAKRLAEFKGTSSERLVYAFLLAYGRLPKNEEAMQIQSFFNRFPQALTKGNSSEEAKKKAQFAALSAFCQSLFASAEFRYLN
ncbi:MAG: Protein of unknown function (DUF1553)/Protein of unknown function (DUF1549)/Planctomycete [Verrucomicrobiaceae bacterium]|nr:Protein of unknown function (DUF1553)/Protein of unknown function (DUF1549)/Planctomycete [Verrucomicrobiaceae bacterium]